MRKPPTGCSRSVVSQALLLVVLVETGALAFWAARSRIASFYRAGLLYGFLVSASLALKLASVDGTEKLSDVLHTTSAAVLPLVFAEAVFLGEPRNKPPALLLVSVSAVSMAIFAALDKMSYAAHMLIPAITYIALVGVPLVQWNRGGAERSDEAPHGIPSSEDDQELAMKMRFGLFICHALKLHALWAYFMFPDPCGNQATPTTFALDAFQLGWLAYEPIWQWVSTAG